MTKCTNIFYQFLNFSSLFPFFLTFKTWVFSTCSTKTLLLHSLDCLLIPVIVSYRDLAATWYIILKHETGHLRVWDLSSANHLCWHSVLTTVNNETFQSCSVFYNGATFNWCSISTSMAISENRENHLYCTESYVNAWSSFLKMKHNIFNLWMLSYFEWNN